MNARPSFLVPALAVVLSLTAIADLDRIDADGITETGGLPAYARMIPRTGGDGRLSATLLPPVADWASQPISNLYYAAGNATVQGNGSPQYPFKTLTYALAHVAPESAVLLAPATYSGSGSLPGGQTLTLCGFGRASYVESLSLTVGGSLASTELRLCGLRVGTLTVNGGRVNIRLADATVGTLTGYASPVAVTRTDLGASVGAVTLSHGCTDSYVGYSAVPKAHALADPTNPLRQMAFSGDRAIVGSSVVAYVSDITGATNAVYVTIGALSDEDARLAGLISTETVVRASADLALSNALDEAVSTLNTRITAIGNGWSAQLSALSSSIGTLGESLSALQQQEEADILALEAELSAIRSEYVAADAVLGTTLRGEFADGLSDLRDDVPEMARTVFDTRIIPVTNRIYRLEKDLLSKHAGVTNRLAILEKWKVKIDAFKGSQLGTNALFRTKINGIIDSLNQIKTNAVPRPTYIPPKIP